MSCGWDGPPNKLDEAIAELDGVSLKADGGTLAAVRAERELREASARSERERWEAAREDRLRCPVVKRNGQRCKNRNLNGRWPGPFCRSHGCRERGCPERAARNACYCARHLAPHEEEWARLDREARNFREWCAIVRPVPASVHELQQKIAGMHAQTDWGEGRYGCGTCGPGWPCATYAVTFGGQVYSVSG